MDRKVFPFDPAKAGTIVIPPSKSQAHRSILCASLAFGRTVIRNLAYSEDILVTMNGMRRLGARIILDGDTAVIDGIGGKYRFEGEPIDCGESGSSLRFFVPIFSLCGQKVTFTGRGRLLQRPQGVYQQVFAQQGLSYTQTEREITIEGSLCPGVYEVAGNVSSQFLSGLLFALPLLEGESVIRIKPPFESRSYVDLTIAMLARFGVCARYADAYTIKIAGRQQYRGGDYTVEGDYSQFAFFAVLAAINGDLLCRGLDAKSKQGDRVIVDILRRCGVRLLEKGDGYLVKKSTLYGAEIDLADCPDLGPILMVMGMFAKGVTRIYHAGRLRDKESDRIAAMEQELRKCGVVISSTADEITIEGGFCQGRELLWNGHNDHRIVMSLSVAAASGIGAVIQGSQAVAKSYPAFFDDLVKAGVGVEELEEALPDLSHAHVVIVGLGLIGGSYAKALHNAGCSVGALDLDASSIAFGKEQGFLDDGQTVPDADFFAHADLVVLGLYPQATVDWIAAYQHLLPPHTLLTDTSGVKCGVVEPIQKLLRADLAFLGSHPMAGRETSGVRGSDARIFANANFLITPTDKNTLEQIALIRSLAKLLGFSKISVLSPREHDKMIGFVSQLTHTIAVSLMNCNDNPHLKDYTGDSFRDLTRIAKINERLWSELFLLNREALTEEIDDFVGALEELRDRLKEGDQAGVQALLRQARQRKEKSEQ